MTDLEQSRLLTTELPGPRSIELAKRKTAAVSHGIGTTMPVYCARAGGGIVEDVDGNRLIDLGSGIAVTTIGNASPRVVDAVRAQVADFTHTCFMITPYEEYVAVCEQLNRLTPGDGEKRSVLFNSGAEAVENAIKIARSYTKKTAVVAFDHAYHGRTNLTMGLTAKSMPYKSGFGPFAPEIYRAPMSYPYRDGLVDKEMGTNGELAAERALSVDRQAGRGRQPGRDHHRTDPGRGRLRRARRRLPGGAAPVVPRQQRGVHRRRSADRFRPHGSDVRLRTRGHRTRPDLYRQGHRQRSAAVRRHGPRRDHGRPARVAGSAAPTAATRSRVPRRWPASRPSRPRGLLERAAQIETLMKDRLGRLQADDDRIGDVRGRGAMIAIELVKSGTADPDPDLTKKLAAGCHAAGVIVLTCGTYGNILRFLPPLTISDELLTEGLDVLALILADL